MKGDITFTEYLISLNQMHHPFSLHGKKSISKTSEHVPIQTISMLYHTENDSLSINYITFNDIQFDP